MTIATLRPAEASDEPEFAAAFMAARRPRFELAGLSPAALGALLRQQYDSQRAGYRGAYPGAVTQAIVAEGRVVGRLITDSEPASVTLVDIVVHPESQGRGLGTSVLRAVLARAGDRPVALRVDHGAPAEQWYRSHGFVDIGADALQAHLVHDPAALPALVGTAS